MPHQQPAASRSRAPVDLNPKVDLINAWLDGQLSRVQLTCVLHSTPTVERVCSISTSVYCMLALVELLVSNLHQKSDTMI